VRKKEISVNAVSENINGSAFSMFALTCDERLANIRNSLHTCTAPEKNVQLSPVKVN